MTSGNLNEDIFSLWQRMRKCKAMETWFALTKSYKEHLGNEKP